MNYQIVWHIALTCMLGIVLVATQGNAIPEYKETCQNEKYDGGRLNCFEGYCSSVINGETEPDHKYNSNCKMFCPKCYKAWSAYNESLWQSGKADPTTPPVTDPRKDSTSTSSPPTTDPRPDPTGPSGGNSSAWDQVWPALVVIAIVAIVAAIVIGIYYWKKRRTGCARPTSNQSTGIREYTPVPMEVRIVGARNSADNALEGPPTPQSKSNGTVPKASVSSLLIPNGTGPHTETETLTGATPSLTPNGTGPPTGDNPLEGVTPQWTPNGISPHTGTEPQTGAIPPLTPNGTTPQMGNIPEMGEGPQIGTGPQMRADPEMGAGPQRGTGPQFGAAPQPVPNGVPSMGANSPAPQVVTNSNTGGNNTTQQSAGAGGSVQSTTIGTVNYNFFGTVPPSSEPAPTTTAVPQEHLSTPVQEKGKGAELETTQEVRDDVGGPHKFSPPD